MELELIILCFLCCDQCTTTLTKACQTVIFVELVTLPVVQLLSSRIHLKKKKEDKKEEHKTVPKPPGEEL